MSEFVAVSADVSDGALIGNGVKIWHLAQVREGANIGDGSIVGRGAYVDHGVIVGRNSKIQNYALVYGPAELGIGVFIGPAAMLTNDMFPRAVTPDFELKGADDWEPAGTVVEDGVSIGARAVILPGLTIGQWAMVAAGAVVTSNVPAHALMVGVPARQLGWVGKSGKRCELEGAYWVDPYTKQRYIEDNGRLKGAP
jgi:UDP-2-acetamido-3-amino-2,3-dideoxy-glucuronate N-acetyltransferase